MESSQGPEGIGVLQPTLNSIGNPLMSGLGGFMVNEAFAFDPLSDRKTSGNGKGRR